MEPKAAELLSVLKNNNLSIDAKVAHLTSLKSDIKQKNVPEGAVASIFECLRLCIGSQHQSILAGGFSTLIHFLKRLFIQEQHHLVTLQARILYPILLERLGDHKERVRALAAQAFTDLWPAASAEVEHYVLEVALVGKNPKSKEMSMIWLANMTKEHGLLFRSYVPSLVACLEDADSAVRDTAKLTVVELFQNAPARAKSDLQSQLVSHNVRKSIASVIISSIGLGTGDMDITPRAESSYHTSLLAENRPPRPPSRGDALHQRPKSRLDAQPARPPSRGDVLHQRPLRAENQPARPPSRGDALHQRPISHIDSQPARPPSRGDALHQTPRPPSRGDALHQRPASNAPAGTQHRIETAIDGSMSTLQNEATSGWSGPAEHEQDRMTTTTRASSQDGDNVEPLFVASSREFDDMMRDMLPCFEGRESEENWMRREKSVLRLRQIVHGNAPNAYPQNFIVAMKSLLDGIFKVVNSLRTTLSTAGCLMVQDLARICGPRIDSMVEIIMQNLVKLCGGMKKITAQNGNATVIAVLENVTYTPRLLHHVTSASQDRNVQLRLHAAGWIKTLINRQAHHKSSIEHGGGVELLEKCIKKCLSDANPGVREAIRGTFWAFHRVWPGKGNEIISGLDNKSRSLLEKDPSNPNVDQALKNSDTSRKGLASSTSATSSRSALKEAIAAQRKARLAPTKSLPPRPESAQSSLAEAKPSSDLSTKPSAVRTVPTGSHLSSLSSAPMRPAAKTRRPELNRPATADPYASRRAAAADLRSKAASRMENSPRAAKSKPSTPSKSANTRPNQNNEAFSSSSTTKGKPKKLDLSRARLKDPPIAVRHERSDSNESVGYNYIDKSNSTMTTRMPDDVESSDAIIQLESPIEDVIRPAESSLGEHPSHGRNNLTLDDQPQPFEEHTVLESPHKFVSELQPLEVPEIAPSATATNNKHPEPVLIYEDPATNHHDHEADVISGEHHSFDDSQPENVVRSFELPPENITSPTRDGEQDRIFDTYVQHENASQQVPSTVPSDNETHSDFLHIPGQAGPDNHLPMRNSNPAATVEPPKSHDNLILASPGSNTNNENTTPNLQKVSMHLTSRLSTRDNALEELPTNEPGHRDNTPVLHVPRTRPPSGATASMEEAVSRRWKKFESLQRRRSISPRSSDPAKAREMLEKGIQRIRAGSMDILGYRKLQGLIEFHDTIFTDEAKYDEMLIALLDELQSPLEDKKQQQLGRPLDLKTQVLLTIRFMLTHNKKYFSAYHPRAMTALIGARKNYESNSHILSGLEETTNDIIEECEPGDIVDAVVDLVSTEEDDEKGNLAIGMGFSVLTKIMCRLSESKGSLPEHHMERIGSLAAAKIANKHPDIRRQVTQLCVQLRSMATSDDHYWSILGWPREGTRNLLTYYIARKQ